MKKETDQMRLDPEQRIYAASCTCTYDPQIPVWRYRLALLSGGFLGVLVGLGGLWLSFALAGSGAAFFQCFGVVSILNGAVNLLLPASPDRALIRQIKEGREKSE